jgi:cytochrome b6-f complex iron-sulfur subunit
VERRSFLKSLLGIFSLSTFITFLYPLFRFLSPGVHSAKKVQVTIPKTKIPAGEAYRTIFDNTPVMVIHHPNKGYIALSRVCTHLGCLVNYDRSVDRLICPCHGANFTIEGKVISGPAPTPLARYPVSIKGENLIIG